MYVHPKSSFKARLSKGIQDNLPLPTLNIPPYLTVLEEVSHTKYQLCMWDDKVLERLLCALMLTSVPCSGILRGTGQGQLPRETGRRDRGLP